MSISTSSEFKSMRKSRSLPHIASRHESGVSNATASTTISGSCSILDQMDLDSVGCNDHHLHHHHRFDNNNPNEYHARTTHRHYNNSGKYNKHNNNYFRHQQCENVRKSSILITSI